MGIHEFNGRKTVLKRGCLFLLTPADFHEIVPDAGETLRLFNAIFVRQFIRPELLQWIFQAGGGMSVDLGESDFRMVEQEFERIWSESEIPDRGSEWIKAGSLERVLITLLRQWQGVREGTNVVQGSVLHPSISKAVTLLSYQFHEPLTLEAVSRHVGLSASYFSECFRKETGVPFQKYLQEERLKFAYSLLGMTQLPITEVCYASGFGSLSHFERAFKGKYGRTPRQIRNES